MDQKSDRVLAQLRSTAGGLEHKYLTFLLDQSLFGLPITEVVQIIGLPQITQVPEYPNYMRGVIDLRGEIVPLVDVRLRFGKPERDFDTRTCVIIANIRGRGFGFIVDEVDEVTYIAPELVSPPTQLSEDSSTRYLTGIARLGSKIILLLSPSHMLSDQEFTALAQAANASGQPLDPVNS
ncbi:MAG: chemotaxis protein CheW [Lawsonibacter sp.]|nr:chemotaxis protein CheW [Lawsonibacter sp.]